MAENGFQFQCPECKALIEISDAQGGGEVVCAACGKTVPVPEGRFAPGAVFGDFLIERELGSGGMGKVFLAHQLSLDRPAAIKILKPEFSGESESVRGFIREARSAAKLNHPNIVQAYAVGEIDGIFYFAMEYVNGRTMKEVLAERGRIQFDEAAKMILQVADALDTAWREQKLVHHDIKPDNMLLCDGDRIKLSDLGLASGFGEDADDGSDEVLGTPQYISPEQLTGVVTDTRSDIYSLGATFYHLVTGQFPYTADDPDEIAKQHVYGTLTPPRQVYPLLPEDLNQIIIKMMAKDPKDRFQTGGEVVAALRKHLSGGTGMGLGGGGGLAPATDPGKLNRLHAPETLSGGLQGSANGFIQPKLQPSSEKLQIGFKNRKSKPAVNTDEAVPPETGETPQNAEAAPAASNEPETPNATEEAVVASMTARAMGTDPGRKKRTGVRIAVIAAAVLLIAGGVIAAVCIFGKSSSPAPAAVAPAPEKKPEPSPAPKPVSAAPAIPRTLQIPVATTPAPAPVAAAPQKDDRLLREIRSLLNQRGNDRAFLTQTEKFLNQHPTASGFEEAQALGELRKAYVQKDEQVVIAPARSKLLEQEKKRRQERAVARKRQAQYAALAEREQQHREEALRSPEGYRNYLEEQKDKLDFLFLDAAETGDPKRFEQALAMVAGEPERVASYRGYGDAAEQILCSYALQVQYAYDTGKRIHTILQKGDPALKDLRVNYYPQQFGEITKIKGGVITIAVEEAGQPAIEWRPEERNVAYNRLLFSAINAALRRQNLYFFYMLYNRHFDVDFRPDAPDAFWYNRVPQIGLHYFYWKLKLGTETENAALLQRYGKLALFQMAAAQLEKERAAETRKAAQ